jgi:hypothetical protein
VRVALALGCVVLVAAVVAQLAHDAPRLAGSNDIEPSSFVVFSEGGQRVCQADETLFEDTASVRMTIGTYGQPTPPLEVRWTKAGRVVESTELAAGWAEGVVRIPLSEVPPETVGDTTLCVRPQTKSRLAFGGQSASNGAIVGGESQDARVSVLSDLSGSRSLFEMLSTAARRYPAGNAGWLGTWSLWGIFVILAGALVAAGAALLRHRDGQSRRIPISGWLCALTAFLVCAAWAVLTPPFQVPDEISHVAYVQALAESADLPLEHEGAPYSEQERELLTSLSFYDVIGRDDARPPWTAPEEADVRAAESASSDRDVSNATTASANPPLFYLLETPIYWVTPSDDLLDKLLPMRLLSALLGAITVLAVFLFLRELVPRSPWLWSAGALICALHPGFGFISSGVNPDALLFTAGATMFLLVARLVRHGPTPKRIAALGAVVAVGLLTKPLFLGLVPAAALAVLVAAFIGHRAGAPSRTVLRLVAIGAAAAVIPVLTYHGIGKLAFDHPYFAESRTVAGTVGTSGGGSLRDEMSYVWQLFLPSVPGLQEQFPKQFPLRDIWLDGFTGQFGWLDYGFPPWVLDWVTWLAVALLIAAVVSLVLSRRRMGWRWLEFGVYAVASAGIAVAIGTQDYAPPGDTDPVRFTQARYLFPLLALYGGLVAVALRVAGARAGPYLAVALVGLAAIHDVSGMLLTVSRYYL